MPDKSDKDAITKAYHIWASVHGIVGILRQSKLQGKKSETLDWIENNLEEYLEMTTFGWRGQWSK